ncbi:hypothetical protein CK203_114225 [Vitis vinifera]|uniref:Uncharacterized protein n=1 Tax=Vitis vinifera TaxID=29760 RepID=A0A438CA47_VITVI|nr:hypothetical protein CK203_114225 [Vitis vinifera]
MLEIPNMAEEELLFNFMDNLQSWAEQELRRRGVQDLATTMAVAESLWIIKGRLLQAQATIQGNQAKGGGDKRSQGHTPKEGSSKGPSGKDGKGKDKRKEFTPRTNCFLCDGPHWARDCPKRKALNAMIEEKEQEGDAKMGSLQLLNALKAKPMPKTPQSKGLMYVEALVNGKAPRPWWTQVPLITLSRKEGKKGRLHSGTHGRLQDGARNGLPTEGQGRATTFLRSMAILEEEKPCMVPTVTEGMLKTPMLSAMQVKKGLKGKRTLCPELPKRLPPRREEDHKIELEPGAKPPAMGPYRMAPPSWRN